MNSIYLKFSKLPTFFWIPFYILYFPLWWYGERLVWWGRFIFRTLLLFIDGLSLVPVAKALFKPYHEDYTWVGRLMGFITRLFWLLAGSIFLVFFFFLLIGIFVIWLLWPLSFYLGLRLKDLEYGNFYFLIGLFLSILSPLPYFFLFITQPKLKTFFINEKIKGKKENLNLFEAKETFALALKKIFSKTYTISALTDFSTLSPTLLFKNLLEEKKIKMVLKRLNLKGGEIFEKWEKLSKKRREKEPLLLDTLFLSLKKSLEFKRSFLDTDMLLLGFFKADRVLEKFFRDRLEIDYEDIENTVLWVDGQIAALHRWEYWNNPYFYLRGGADRAWAAGWIPHLKHYIFDVTKKVAEGRSPYIVGREKEMEEIIRILSRTTKNNVLLVGEPGVGKTSVVEAIAQKMIQGKIKGSFEGKKLVSLDLAALLAGAGQRGDFEKRLKDSIYEIEHGRIVLFIDDIHNMVGAGTSGAALDAASVFVPALSEGRFQCIGATTHADFRRYLEKNATFSSLFQKVEITEPSDQEAIVILENFSSLIEKRQGVTITYPAIEEAVKLSRGYIQDQVLPEKAVNILDETAVFARDANKDTVTSEDIAKIIAKKTGIPLTKITLAESEKLLNLERQLHKRIIGQEAAVEAVSNALRRARAGLKDFKRPIASFLFLGPTGVGKTETAKTLSEAYFGSEEQMIRLDMSEFQGEDSVNRLIGAPPGYAESREGGQLTEAVRQKPFSLLLLDEIEKAHPKILDLFLQVLDDGRLTDSLGRTVSFQNTIIIATSNAVTKLIGMGIEGGLTVEGMEKNIRDALQEFFRLEFLNRFDGVVVFKPLTKEEIIAITHLLLLEVERQLKEKDIEFAISEEAVEKIAEIGFDPVFGARPLRRVIQEKVENKLAEKIISGEIKRGEKIHFNLSDLE